ncbi:MAG: hypothetical protein HY653_03355 [Acidobacteria bacterium]|nr:hypothetical protein [Acidobacteriota bacterium]
MKLRTVVALLALVLGTSFTSPARDTEQPIKLDDLPAAVKKTVLEVSTGVKLRELTREVKNGETFYEAELDVNGRTRDVIMDASGAIVLVEEEVDWSLVPAAVRATIETAAQGRKILFVETLTRNGRIEAYEAHVRKGWWREREIKVDPEGRPIEEK